MRLMWALNKLRMVTWQPASSHPIKNTLPIFIVTTGPKSAAFSRTKFKHLGQTFDDFEKHVLGSRVLNVARSYGLDDLVAV